MLKKSDKVFVTGGSSMLGKAILRQLGDSVNIYSPTHKELDLLNNTNLDWYISQIRPTHIIHCAGFNGNISFNQKYPTDIFYQTTQIGLNVLNLAEKYKVKKIVSLISSCAYPDLSFPLKEIDFWQGEPNRSIDAHGYSKRVLMEYGNQLNKKGITQHSGMIVNTAYGPFDNYDVEKTKVIGGLIKKISDAKHNNLSSIECWGDGTPKREFIYCDDVAKYAILALENYYDPIYPLNIGSGVEYSINDIVNIIKNIIGYNGNIIWNTSKPNGQMRKLLDNTKMKTLFGNLEFVPLNIGLKNTIEWYNHKYNI